MKNTPIILLASLMFYLALLVGCQPNQIEDQVSISPTYTPSPTRPSESSVAVEEQIPATATATMTTTAMAMPIVTNTASMMPTSTPPATPTTGEVHISSEPDGAWASVINENLGGQTPLTWMLSPGTYTVTLTLPGYKDWASPITVTAGSSRLLTPILRQHHTIIPVAEPIVSVWDLKWADNGQSLVYAISDQQWPSYVRSLPVYQSWWLYDINSGENQAIPPPKTEVSNPVREALGICPFPQPETRPYPCSPTLWESPTSNRIVFSSGAIDGDANTWLADKDGSNVIYLDQLRASPEIVMWSSNGLWLLIGQYNGVSNTYYLVSIDGAFVESLEQLTETSHWRVEKTAPQFSPDGEKVAFVGIETNGRQLTPEQLEDEEAYNLYILDLNSMDHQLVSPRFGVLQWATDGKGLYILDGSANTVGNSFAHGNRGVLYAELYYIDLALKGYPEQKLAGDIPLYLPYPGRWTYSPETRIMAGTFNLDSGERIFSILPILPLE